MDCWNEAAGAVHCDPEVDDECLCGEFFDEVAACTSTTCNIGENLGEYRLSTILSCTITNVYDRSDPRLHGGSV